MKKNRIMSLALAGALCFSLLAGCGGNGGGSGTADQPSANPGAQSAAPDQGGAAGGSIKVGLLANTTGDAAMYGNAVKNGAMLYIDQVNAAGGVNGKQIEVVAYDEKGDPVEATTAYSRLKEEGVTAIIGSVLTQPTIAVADATFADNMPQITASATAPGVTLLDPNSDSTEIRTNVFRSCFIDPFQGEKMAQYAFEKLGAKTAAVICQTGSDYSEGLAAAFVSKCEELGVTVVEQQGYAKGDVDFKAQLTSIAGKDPDVIFSPNYYNDDGPIVNQARQVGVTGTFLGGDGWGSVKDYASAEDLEGSVYCSGYAPGANETVTKFETAYKAKFNEDVPNMFAPLGYDAAMLMVEAIKAAEDKGLAAGSDEYKQAVIDAMKATKGLEGITGSYAFDELNNPIKSAAIIELKGGNEVFKELF